MTINWGGLYYVYGNKRTIGNSRNDDRNIHVCVSHNLGDDNMKVGDLVRSLHDHSYHGIIVETAPVETRIDHGDNVCKVQWFDGDISFEFLKVLEILSEGR